MKRSILVLTFFCCLSSLFAQKISPTVLSSAGDVMKANNFSIEWTLGELATETLRANNLIITQGFHQTNLTIVSTNNPEISGLNIYPNPFEQDLIINNQSGKKVAVHIFNVMGQCINDYQILPGTQNITLSELPSGIYILEATTNDQKQNFKIEKIK